MDKVVTLKLPEEVYKRYRQYYEPYRIDSSPDGKLESGKRVSQEDSQANKS
jgi:hypothetical protein